jgi:hypothetical protein
MEKSSINAISLKFNIMAKSKTIRKKLEDSIAVAKKIEEELKQVEQEEKEMLDEVRKQIETLCEEHELVCGIVLTKGDIVKIIELALQTNENITIPFNLYTK